MYLIARICALGMLSLVCPNMLTAQVDSPSAPVKVYQFAEVMPEYPGGIEALYTFLARQIEYPPVARDNGVEGTVYAEFVVMADGSISNIEIRRGLGAGCDEEVLRVIALMPNWMPGKQDGVPVNVQYTLPVTFKMSGGKREKKSDKRKNKE